MTGSQVFCAICKAAEQALKLRPDFEIAYYNLGNLYVQRGRLDLAQRHFEEALRILPNYAEAHSNYGQLLAERGVRPRRSDL